MMETRSGGCLCGTVRFTVTGRVGKVVYCHCSQCRRQTGHFYAAANVDNSGLAIEGAERLSWYAASPDARRGFCANCGSALFWKPVEGDYTSVMAGAFDTPSGLKARAHIFVADKGDYYTIDDGLPQHDGPD